MLGYYIMPRYTYDEAMGLLNATAADYTWNNETNKNNLIHLLVTSTYDRDWKIYFINKAIEDDKNQEGGRSRRRRASKKRKSGKKRSIRRKRR